MGSVYKAHCDCGFTADVSVGGTRRNFLQHATYPFYCKYCGLVEVNIAQIKDSVVDVYCPKCGEGGCRQYGEPPISPQWVMPTAHWWKRLIGNKTYHYRGPVVQWGGRKSPESGNLCPSCKGMKLNFSITAFHD